MFFFRNRKLFKPDMTTAKLGSRNNSWQSWDRLFQIILYLRLANGLGTGCLFLSSAGLLLDILGLSLIRVAVPFSVVLALLLSGLFVLVVEAVSFPPVWKKGTFYLPTITFKGLKAADFNFFFKKLYNTLEIRNKLKMQICKQWNSNLMIFFFQKSKTK